MSPDDGRVRIALACEDDCHRALAMALFDAVVQELVSRSAADWFEPATSYTWTRGREPDNLEERRRFHRSSDAVPSRPHWKRNPRIAGQPLHPAAGKLRVLYEHLSAAHVGAGLVILLQDSDGDVRIQRGAAQVVDLSVELQGPLLVIGVPHREGEAWLIAGWTADDPDSVRRHAVARASLSFDPSHEPERLSSHPNDAVQDAKRVLQYLVLGAGDHLSMGRPASLPPTPEAADALAARLASALPAARRHERTGLQAFIGALGAAASAVFENQLGPPGTS